MKTEQLSGVTRSGMKRSALLALPFSSCNLTRSKISLSLSRFAKIRIRDRETKKT